MYIGLYIYIHMKRYIRSLIQLGEAAAFPVTQYN